MIKKRGSFQRWNIKWTPSTGRSTWIIQIQSEVVHFHLNVGKCTVGKIWTSYETLVYLGRWQEVNRKWIETSRRFLRTFLFLLPKTSWGLNIQELDSRIFNSDPKTSSWFHLVQIWLTYIRDPRTKPGWSRSGKMENLGLGRARANKYWNSRTRPGPTRFWKSRTDSDRSVDPWSVFWSDSRLTCFGSRLTCFGGTGPKFQNFCWL